MRITGLAPEAILDSLSNLDNRVNPALEKARQCVTGSSMNKAVYPYQAAALFMLAKTYNRPDATMLEIGTYYGYTAAVMAQAAPKATLLTLNPIPWEVDAARHNLRPFARVYVVCEKSWDYLLGYASALDFIFVDGDHKQIRRDLPWWNKLAPGGLMLFHDYSPNGGPRACPPVYRALEEFKAFLGREADELIIDNQTTGMAGWYKRDSDPDWRVQDGK